MTNPTFNGTMGGHSGLNLQAYSLTYSKNYRLDQTSSTGQFILRNPFFSLYINLCITWSSFGLYWVFNNKGSF